MSDALFDLDTEGTAAQAQRVRDNTRDAAPDVGVFQGFGSAVGSSAMKGLAGVARTGGMIGAGLLQSSSAPSYALKANGRDTGTDASDMAFKFVDENLNNAVDYWTPNAAQTGKAGQIVGGLVEGIVPLALGPAGVPSMLGNAQVGTSTDLVRQGVDADTALKVGLASSTANAVGFKIPFLGNTLLSRMATGSAGNLAVNAGASLVQEKTLEGKGYIEAAKQYDPANPEARALDVLMGAAFGAITHASMRPTTAQADAVLALRNARNFQQESAPGAPVSAEASAAHQANMESAMHQLMRGEKVDLASTIQEADFVKPPMKETASAIAVREAIADMRPKDAPILPATGARGIRNNNPGNIVKSSTPWQGKIEGNDSRFETFETPELGIRALAKNLIASQEKHGNNTIADIVTRWAPESENNTAAYIAAVAKETGISADSAINLRDPATLQKITNAIINHENGGHPYTDSQIKTGVDLANGKEESLPINQNPESILVKANEEGNFLTAESSVGKVGGSIKGDELHINYADVAENMRGKGYGVKLYESLIDDAHSKGLKVFSDSTVEKDAANVYGALERRGYKVENKVAGVLDQEGGAVYGKNAIEPAFEVKPKIATMDDTNKSALPPTPEINSMRQIAQENPTARILDGYDADGQPQYLAVHEAVAKIEAEHAEQLKESQSYDAAVNCFLRRGA